MDDQDTIRKAVELADGWTSGTVGITLPSDGIRLYDHPITGPMSLEQFWLDALAAQLVRQVDALNPDYLFTCDEDHDAYVYDVTHDKADLDHITEGTGGDRTMNTIKAIVDSKVLPQAPV